MELDFHSTVPLFPEEYTVEIRTMLAFLLINSFT